MNFVTNFWSFYFLQFLLQSFIYTVSNPLNCLVVITPFSSPLIMNINDTFFSFQWYLINCCISEAPHCKIMPFHKWVESSGTTPRTSNTCYIFCRIHHILQCMLQIRWLLTQSSCFMSFPNPLEYLALLVK
jgi:hypothetical protein